jgi:hypothetical protein
LLGGEPEPLISDGLRPALAELEAFLVGEPPERLSKLVLVFASTWVLGEVGFDLERYFGEAKTFYELTPEHDRVLSSFPDAMGYYLSLRLMMTEDEEIDREAARAHLRAARDAVAVRSEWLRDDYPSISEGFRRLLTETEGGVPPEDRLWRALARRIGDRYVEDWVLRSSPG